LINRSANAKDAETVDETVSVNSGDIDSENWVTNLHSRIRSRVRSLFRRSPGSLPLEPLPFCSRLRTFSLRRWAAICRHR
jgi:hypothetical protein